MAGQTSTIAASLQADGYAVIERLLDASTVDALVAVVERAQAAAGSPSLRNVLADHPDIRGVLREPTVDAVLREVVGAGWFVVRAILSRRSRYSRAWRRCGSTSTIASTTTGRCRSCLGRIAAAG